MLTTFKMTVRKYLYLGFMAVFFSGSLSAADSSLTTLENSLNELIFNLSRSVVTVESSRRIPVTGYDGVPDEALQRLVSSGIICDSAGYILVAAPMVVDQEHIMVNLNNRLYTATLVGIDYYTDLALIKTQPGIGQPVVLPDRYACAGQMVVTVGNAYGLRTSPSLGFCAGTRDDGNIQTTVPITTGTIGGGLFDLSGNLLGVITGRMEEGNHFALAVPVYKIQPVIDYLVAHGSRQAGYIGITGAEIEIFPPLEVKESATFINAGDGNRTVSNGVVITTVMPQSPADRIGLKRGDIILSYNKRPVTASLSLADEVRHSVPGTPVDMEILRRNTLYNVQIQVGQKTIRQFEDNYRLNSNLPENALMVDSLTEVLRNLKEEIRHVENRLNNLR
ncbi:MAG: S1C family serine protease [Candidatus Zixiibacteriota bacterium]